MSQYEKMNREALINYIESLKKQVEKHRGHASKLQSKIMKLEKDLGILEVEGFIEEPSLPPILIGGGLNGAPVCSEHGAMLRYDNNIWRCESCKGKPSVDLTSLLKFIQRELTVMLE